jgi:hypothetical protein
MSIELSTYDDCSVHDANILTFVNRVHYCNGLHLNSGVV